ncbi:MAG: phosphotransferase enzyme family protein [Gemmatimonadota bacterium]|nr:phosphotransferase enzyme family protein [Gemmatimonadota bacterium]
MPEKQLAHLFRARFGVEPARILPLAGDGSPRRLFRLMGPGHQTAIGVQGPDHEENTAFLSFSRSFREIGLAVPEIYGADEAQGIYLEEDLGDTTLFDALNAARADEPGVFPESMIPVYRRVVEELPRFQVPGGRVVDYSVAYPRAAFDRQSILWDLNYFKYHFLKLAGIPFNEARLEDDFTKFTEYLIQADTSHFLYRDFQSRNVMLRGGEPWFIDYQGGRRGALQYDIASILYDAKAGLPLELRELLLDHYLDALSGYVPVDREQFRGWYRGYALVRILQAMGAYGYRGFFERKLRFLQSVPPAIVNIERMLAGEWLPIHVPELRRVLETIRDTPALRRTAPSPQPGLTVRVSSFSYRRGYPEDATGHGGGFVFDVRAVHNPGRYAEYTSLTGLDEPVVRFLDEVAEAGRYWENVRSLVELQVESYLARGFNSLGVAFGCTGGQHRSVYFTERLARHLRDRFPEINVMVEHREASRWPGASPSPSTDPGAPDAALPG